jgi:hypothetical protein
MTTACLPGHGTAPVEDHHSRVAKDSNNHVIAPLRDPGPPPDWSSLLLKLFDDLIRIVRGEVRLAAASVAPGIDRILVQTLSRLMLAMIGLCGGVCLMAAAILILHMYLEWWAALGVMGLGLLLIALVGSLITNKSPSS